MDEGGDIIGASSSGDFGEGEEVRLEEGEEEGNYLVKNNGETMSSNKRMKEMSVDRLSALPDSLIIHILSFLDLKVKEVAVTSVLSKRWQFLWSELPGLNFWDRSLESDKVRDFVSWVHRTLLLRTGTYLKQFEVDFYYDESYALDVNAWVRFAVKSKVKELDLGLHSHIHFYTLPQVLYSNSSLQSLRVRRCILAPHRTIEWHSLTQLSIGDVELNEDVIQKILSSCPLLYSLILISCWGFKRLEVLSETIQDLMVLDSDDKSILDLMDISSPFLQTLHVSFSPLGKKLQLTNIASIVSAGIHFTELDKSAVVMINTMELLEKTKHAKDLILRGACIERFYQSVWCLPHSSKRNLLVLETWRDENSIPGILGLLESSPNLEKFLVECCDSYKKSVRAWRSPARNDLDCDLLRLKKVRFMDYADPNLGGEPMLMLARILLKRATALEKMVIDALESLTKYSSEFTKDVPNGT
ncbi:hypothetical protein OROHE_024124 [Orobanche hederae]